jgi:multidrug resistance efflux pump
MPAPFAATLRALDSERRCRGAFGLVAGALLLALWLGWSLGVELALTADSTSATIAASGGTWALAAPADGVIAATALALGRSVHAGELLVALDARDLLARQAGVHARRGALSAEAEALAAQQAATRRALAEDGRAAAAASGESVERARQAAAAAELAEQVRARDARLEAAGLLAAADAARSRAGAEQGRRAAAAARFATAAGTHHGIAAQADRRAAASRLAAELAHLRGELAALAAEEEALRREVAERSLRAPVECRVAETAGARAGSFVARGAPLAILVASGRLRVVASFGSGAAAAIRPGQRAWVHLPAGPLSAPAVLEAAVVATAPGPGRPGGWEVELTLPGDPSSRSPVARPGQPCEVEVELERLTPAALALRALRRTLPRPAPLPAAGEAAP